MAASPPDVPALLAAARAGSREALGQAIEAFRPYLLLVARQELDPAFQGKGGLPTWCRRRSWRRSATSSASTAPRPTSCWPG